MTAAPEHPWRPQRLVYLGTPEMAVPPLRALVAAGFEVVAVVTRADARRGRGSDVSPSPVKAAAFALGIPVVHRVEDICDLPVELGVVVAFGRLIGSDVLAAVPMVNLHFSLLPRWRGAAPVERALLAGDTMTGVCLMQLDEGLDTGPVHACVEVPIGPEQTADELRRDLVAAGSALLVDRLRAGLATPRPQQGEVTYAAKLRSDERRLDWGASAVVRHRTVRLGGAFTTFRGRRLRILEASVVDAAATGDTLVGDVIGGLRLLTVQPESKAPMPFSAFANGARPGVGERFGE